ncbi:hypothetical protein SAMN02799631_05882 [Methylobacterium sp. 174MFSha1.1]|uniref:hypothetical protein n=1 Tax=Methylobacterium sp. 174MFSha1.1 TaxID=1502749 RepID=UPI0008EE7F13|nr:hypothetical protein [Methylobacterium sp. 174MFSha1.1]SFV14490.1 hypothetical protein SAMN02799631_05882 [Methylobacterium sp. 174MFSha1.1]
MPLSLKLPRRNPDAPRPSLRDRYAALKGSAAKVMGKPARFAPPKPIGAGEPSKALAAALAAHEMAYGYALYTDAYGLPDLTERRQAEEEAFRALLHTPLQSDADRAAYAAAVISRQMHSLGDASATERDHPMAVAFRNISFGENAREPEEMRHIGRKAEATTDPSPAAIVAPRPTDRALALLGDLEREWATQIIQQDKDRQDHSPEAEVRNDVMIARRDALMAAAEALPATSREARHAKALAFAWDASIMLWRADRTRDQYGTDGRLMIDLMNSLTGELSNAAGMNVSSLDQPKAIPARFDAYDHETGLVTYADAAGTISTRPAAEWIAFMAMRLHHIARSERTRQFNAECKDLDGAACAALEARLTRELRIDALHALMFRSDQAFAEAQSERNGHTGAGPSAAKVDLKPLTVLQLVNLHEAYQAARHLWEGVVARPYSVAFRDPRGCVHASPVGHLADFEETRAALVGERIIDEIANRSPQTEKERDYILSLRLQHEIACEDRIRDADMMREISQAWGA